MAATETLALEQVLSYIQITGEMYETTMGIPDPLPEEFSTANVKEVVGDEARVMVRKGQRQTARRIEYGGKARETGLISIGYKDAKLVHFMEEMSINLNLFNKLRDTLNYTNQQQGRDELREQHTQFAERFKNSDIAMRQLMLSLGHIYFDVDGNLLPSSSGAVLDIDFGVASNHKGQLAGLAPGGGNVIAASWATASTDIPTHVITLVDYVAPRSSGLPIEYAFYTRTIPSYIFNNTYCQAYLARNAGLNAAFLNRPTQIPNGLFGIPNWIPVTRGFFEDQNGANQDIWADDLIVFTPDPRKGKWLKNIKGSVMVPKSIDIAGEGLAAFANADDVYGMGGYGFVQRSPVKMVMNYFNTYLPALENPDAIWIVDVTP